jgi:hypothetical protein
VVAAPPLVYCKGYACSRDQQRHQDDHGSASFVRPRPHAATPTKASAR